MRIFSSSPLRKDMDHESGDMTGIQAETRRIDNRREARVRSDVAVEEEIWESILKDRSLGHKYLDNLQVDVEEGRVRLRGHVLQPWHSTLIHNVADRVEGVSAVKNELVPDDFLQSLVVQELLSDDLTLPYVFTVKSVFGWIYIGGQVPAFEVARAAEGVASFVPAVRGILSLPLVYGAAWLAESDPIPVRRTIQPRLAAAVYQGDVANKPAAAGMVSQVIIDPISRLVSAVAVRLSGSTSTVQDGVERLVPIESVEAANARQVWLKEGECVEHHPPFDRSKYPLPPAGWQPPFPYQSGEARFSLD